MGNGADYRVKVHAVYKDYLPIDFDLNVKYLPNLDGKTKFVDLGTHIFYKANQKRPTDKYQFWLSNVIDTQIDDDLDTYTLSLHQGVDRRDYYQLNDQENYIEIGIQDSKSVPRIGENRVMVTEKDAVFSNSQRTFFALQGEKSVIEMPLVSRLKDGELAVVLSWTSGQNVVGNNVEIQNLDLHVDFEASETVMCNVDYAMR